jgi:hypothetical protein
MYTVRTANVSLNPKELAHDYLERDAKLDSPLVADLVVQQRQKERNTPSASQSSVSATNDLDARQRAAAERWLKSRQQNTRRNEPKREQDHAPDLHGEKKREHTRGGPEDDVEL